MWTNLDPLVEVVNGALDELSESKVAAMEDRREDLGELHGEKKRDRRRRARGARLAVVLGILITRMISRPLAARCGCSSRSPRATSRSGWKTAAATRSAAWGRAEPRDREHERGAERSEQRGEPDRRGVAPDVGRRCSMSTGAQEQASSLEETAAALEEITGTLKNTAENARKASDRGWLAQRRRKRRQGRRIGGAGDGRDQRGVAQDRRHHRRHRRDRVPDQHARAQRRGGSRARRRAGPRLRGGRGRGAQPRAALRDRCKEIKPLIQDSAAKVETGSALVNHSGETLNEIVASAKQVTDIIAEIASASREQSVGVDQVNGAISRWRADAEQRRADRGDLLDGRVARRPVGAPADAGGPLPAHSSSPMNRVPEIGLNVYGGMSRNPSLSYMACAASIVGSVSSTSFL